MESACLEDVEVAAKPLFMVRVSTKNGTFSVAYAAPDLALTAVASFQEHGLHVAGVFDSSGKKLDYADLKASS